MHESYHIVLAHPDWTATSTVVADVVVTSGRVEISLRKGMYIEDEAQVATAIQKGERRFQSIGYALPHLAQTGAQARIDKTDARLNVWRYLILPLDSQAGDAEQEPGHVR